MLHFGRFKAGSSSVTRPVDITNGLDFPLTAHLRAYEWIQFSENDFRLDPGEVKEVRIISSVPYGTDYGNYSGSIDVVFKRALIGKIIK